MNDRKNYYIDRIQALNSGQRILLAEQIHAEENSSLKHVTDSVSRLTAFVVLDQGVTTETGGLRDLLTTKLPDYMIPSDFVMVDSIPLTPNGKVDRRKLAHIQQNNSNNKTTDAEPINSIESTLQNIWQDLLNRNHVAVTDDFFHIGGHSLLATRLVSRIKSVFQLELPLNVLFQKTTIQDLASHIVTAGETSSKAEDTQVSMLPRDGHLPLSFAQQRLWFLERLAESISLYNLGLAFLLSGAVDVTIIKKSINEIIRRHEVLRTTFVEKDGYPELYIKGSLVIEPEIIYVPHLSSNEHSKEIQRWIDEEVRIPFDLENGPLIRIKLLYLGEHEYAFIISMHHIVFDGWSTEVFNYELSQLYNAYCKGQPSSLSELPIQYADFAAWQRQSLEGERLEEQLTYWREHLRDITPLDLPFDHPRPLAQTFNCNTYSFQLSKALKEELHRLSREEGVTLFMLLLAAFQCLLYRYTGQDDIIVGTPIANRKREDIEGLIGFFVNTLVIRADLAGAPTFREFLKRVRKVILAAYAHQDIPFEKLVEELQPERDLSRTPLFQVLFALQNEPASSLSLFDLEVTPLEIESPSVRFDLEVYFKEEEEGLNGALLYNTDLFDDGTVERFAGHFQTLLEGIVKEPDYLVTELPLLTESEHIQLLVEWNESKREYPKEANIHELFEGHVERTPDSVALLLGRQQMTYGELNAKANQVAHYLQGTGVGADVMVGLCMERSLEMIIGLLGIIKAGGAYVPLDPSYPKERLLFMLEDTQIKVLLTQEELLSKLPEYEGQTLCLDRNCDRISYESKENPSQSVTADNLAYVMYTSGSTGKPKGVSIIHRGVVRLVKQTNYIDITKKDVFLQFAPISFDASTFEIWGALLNGARLVLFPGQQAALHELGDVIRRYSVTILWLTSGLFHEMVEHHIEGLRSVKYLLAGGDVLSPRHVGKVLTSLKGCRLINGYGPTENTTFTCCHVMMSQDPIEDAVSIGKPISNTQVYILDDYSQPVPVGVPGELYIGGDGLARGYFNRPELTAEKFIPNPFSENPKDLLYRSGDIARYRQDGTIEFLGRKDRQIKIRGFRIELGEIDSAIKKYPAVNDATVIIRADWPGDKRIVAYIVLKQKMMLKVEELRASIRNKLPEYMVPSAFICMDRIPLTQNGKIDRKALPVPDPTLMIKQENYLAPRDSLEIQIAKTWEKALGVSPIGIRDNFFDLGGHSLLAVQVLSHSKKLIGKEIPVAELFKSPTVEQLAEIVRSEGWSSPFSLLIPFQPLGSKAPFFCIHGAATEAANLIGLDQPFYGGMPHGADGKRFPSSTTEMATDYIKEIKAVQPNGPYFIGGFSFGGMLAFEIAHQLKAQGQKIALLVLIDPSSKSLSDKSNKDTIQFLPTPPSVSSVKSFSIRMGKRFMALGIKEKIVYIVVALRKRLLKRTGIEQKVKMMLCDLCCTIGVPVPKNLRYFYRNAVFKRAAQCYTPTKFAGPVVILKAMNAKYNLQHFWQSKIENEIDVHDVPGEHLDLFEPPQVEVLARKLKICLEKARNNISE